MKIDRGAEEKERRGIVWNGGGRIDERREGRKRREENRSEHLGPIYCCFVRLPRPAKRRRRSRTSQVTIVHQPGRYSVQAERTQTQTWTQTQTHAPTYLVPPSPPGRCPKGNKAHTVRTCCQCLFVQAEHMPVVRAKASVKGGTFCGYACLLIPRKERRNEWRKWGRINLAVGCRQISGT